MVPGRAADLSRISRGKAGVLRATATAWQARNTAPMLTVEPILTETAFFLPARSRAALAGLAGRGVLQVHGVNAAGHTRMAELTSLRVFGSLSRGDPSDDSDVDLLVTLAPGSSALALGGLLPDAQELLGRRVDVVTEARVQPVLRERVMATAAPL